MAKLGSTQWFKEKSKKPKSPKTVQIIFWHAVPEPDGSVRNFRNSKTSLTLYLFEDEFNELLKFFEKSAHNVESNYNETHMIGRIDVYMMRRGK